MAITQKIAQLTALALKDKVLTMIEKKTIINVAIQEGIPEEEIILYLDNALKESMKSLSKEQLKHCPFCGGQVPLISNECIFCGNTLSQNNQEKPIISKLNGQEADIINRENFNTANKQHDIKTCPNCGAPFPLISNICSFCGFILHEQADSELNINNLKTNIERNIEILKLTPNPSFFDVLKYRSAEVLAAFAVFFLIISKYYEGIGTWQGGLLLISIVLLIISTIKLHRKTNARNLESPVKTADETFYKSIHLQEMYSRHISTLYGSNQEAQKLLQTFSQEINFLKSQRNKNRNMLFFCGLALIATIFILPLFSPSSDYSYQKNKADNPKLYELSEIKKVIKPLPSLSTIEGYKPYFKVSSDAVLSFDLLEPLTYISYSTQQNPYFRVRISNIKLESTGKKMLNTDNILPEIILWDKNKNNISKQIKSIRISTADYVTDSYDNIYAFLENGYDNYYADFTSKDSINNLELLNDIAENAYYFTIY
ncbi:MAG: hypothetical protein IJ150_12265 [Bacteroidales bacterium]|nr:hypothetical protein [Bacteroidales bacterium]